MLKIEKTKFMEKFTEINIRQRMYEGESYITLIINTEFYPSLVGDVVIGGSLEVKLDIKDVHSLDELVGKEYSGDIGKVTISVNNDGIWEHDTKDEFSVKIKERNGRKLKFSLECDNCKMDTTGIMVSLFTTSTDKDELNKHFSLDDYYANEVTKEIAGKNMMKFFVKE